MKKNKFKESIIIIIVSIVFIGMGIFFIKNSWKGGPINLENLKYNMRRTGPIIIFSLFFIGIGLYFIEMFFHNYILPAKNKIMYLDRIEDDLYIFINNKGKRFTFLVDNNIKLDINKSYNILATRNFITEVLNITEGPINYEKENK